MRDTGVRVRTVTENKLVMEVRTDDAGAYSLGRLEKGHYFIDFADRVTVELRISETATAATETLNVIIPRGAWWKGGFLKTGILKTGVIAAGGSATAVGLVAGVTAVRKNDDKNVVSP